MKRTYKSDLSKGQLKRMISDLRKFRDQELPSKTSEFLQRLADVGITAAQMRMSGSRYESYISFEREVVKDQRKYKEILVYGKNARDFIRTWYTSASGDRVKTAEVNPILMAEFGSGINANTDGHINAEGLGGRGTFPGQSHAFDRAGWFWYEEPGDETSDENTYMFTTQKTGREKHRSLGEMRRAPMLAASNEMYYQIRKIAQDVFG